MLQKILRLLILSGFVLSPSLYGCTSGVILGVSAGSAYFIIRDKTLDITREDVKINMAINKAISNSDYSSPTLNLEIKVHRGVVYLIGRVKSDTTREFLIKAAKDQAGVKKIYDEIIVDDNSGMFVSLGRYIADGFLTAQTKCLLLTASNVKSLNYNIESFNGSVYVIGDSYSESESERVSLIAAKAIGAERVVNYSNIIN